MKFLSHSSSISSSSSVSFDPNMCTSKSATAGCLAGILRRILCSGSLPTHPSDHITEPNSIPCDHPRQDFNFKAEQDPKVSPGIVARLMGLDSMPNINLVNTQLNPNSITRSRSLNSVDYKASENEDHFQKNLHRRVKSSLSFREMPSFVELETEEFFILSFENENERREFTPKKKKSEKGFGELKQRRKEKSENREKKKEELIRRNNRTFLNLSKESKASVKPMQEAADSSRTKNSNTCCSSDNYSEEINVASRGLSSSETSYHEEVLSETESNKKKMMRRRRKKQKRHHFVDKSIENETSSEDSSPVSVLDFDKFIIDQELPTSEKDPRQEESNPRRKLCPELQIYRQLSQNAGSNLMEDDLTPNKIGSRTRDGVNQIYIDMWGEICRMTETEIAESNWVNKQVLKIQDELNADFESQILDQMLEEIVIQLTKFPIKALY